MNGYTVTISAEAQLTNIIERLLNAAGIVKALEIAWIASQSIEDGDTPALVRELDYQTRLAENEKHAKELEWDKLTNDPRTPAQRDADEDAADYADTIASVRPY